MKKIFIVLFFCLVLLCGCEQEQKEGNNKLNNEKIEQLMVENEYIILDVRTKEEYDSGHLVDAINIPYDEIDENIDIDKNKILFVYCRSGKRSGIAYEILKELGYVVYDLGSYLEITLPKE